MATEHILSLLIAERDKITKAIDALGGTPKAAAPKAVAVAVTPALSAVSAPKKRKRRALTPVQKHAHSERMKAFWAARRKKAGKS